MVSGISGPQKDYLDAVDRLLRVGVKFDRTPDFEKKGFELDPEAQVARVALSLNATLLGDLRKAAHCAEKPEFQKRQNGGAHITINQYRYEPWYPWYFLLGGHTRETIIINNNPVAPGFNPVGGKGDKDKNEMGAVVAVLAVLAGLAIVFGSGYVGLRLIMSALSDWRLKKELDQAAAELQKVERIFNTNSGHVDIDFNKDVKTLFESYRTSITRARDLLSSNILAKSLGGIASVSFFFSGLGMIHAGLQRRWDWGGLAIYAGVPGCAFAAFGFALKPGSREFLAEDRRQLERHESEQGYTLFDKIMACHKEFMEALSIKQSQPIPVQHIWNFVPSVPMPQPNNQWESSNNINNIGNDSYSYYPPAIPTSQNGYGFGHSNDFNNNYYPPNPYA